MTQWKRRAGILDPATSEFLQDRAIAARGVLALFFYGKQKERSDDFAANLRTLIVAISHLGDREGIDLGLLFKEAKQQYEHEIDHGDAPFTPSAHRIRCPACSRVFLCRPEDVVPEVQTTQIGIRTTQVVRCVCGNTVDINHKDTP